MENNNLSSLKANSVSRVAVILMAISGAAPAMCVGGSFGTITDATGTSVALAFLVATVGVVLAALNYGALAQKHNGCGGTYSYVRAVLGDRAGFWSACIYVVPLLCAAIPCALFSVYMNYLVPAVPGFAWALLIGLVLFFITYRGIELTSTSLIIVWIIQMVMLVWPAIKIIALTSGDLSTGVIANSMQAFNPFSLTSFGMNGLFLGALVCIWAFVGFEAPAYMGEEIKGGAKSVKFCLIVGAIACGLIYAIVCWLWVAAMTPEQFAELKGSGDFLVAYANMVGYLAGGKVVALSIIFSAIACGLVFISMGSRFYFDMGRAGYLPKVFAKTNKYQAPYVGLIVYCIGWVLIGNYGIYGDINVLFNCQAISAVLSYIIICVSNMKEQWPDRGGKSFVTGKIVPLLAIAVLAVMFVTSQPQYIIPLAIWWAVAFIIMLIWYPGFKKRQEAK